MMPIALAYFALVVSLSNHEHNSAHRPALEVANDLVLRGIVRDQSGLPVPHALVYVDGTQISADTDIAGRFALALDPPRAGTLTVFRDGFST
jgi:Carboxypeptidase regulatory-like domain